MPKERPEKLGQAGNADGKSQVQSSNPETLIGKVHIPVSNHPGESLSKTLHVAIGSLARKHGKDSAAERNFCFIKKKIYMKSEMKRKNS